MPLTIRNRLDEGRPLTSDSLPERLRVVWPAAISRRSVSIRALCEVIAPRIRLRRRQRLRYRRRARRSVTEMTKTSTRHARKWRLHSELLLSSWPDPRLPDQ